MSTTVAHLRAVLEARRATDLARVHICIDRDQADTVTTLEAELENLQEVRQATLTKMKENQQAGDRRLGDSPVASIDKQIKTAEADLATAWQTAADNTMVVVLKALPPTGEGSYQEIFDAHTEEFETRDYPPAFCADLAAACYVRAETVDGDDVGYTWEELRPLLFHGDWERVWREALKHNRKSPLQDFSGRRSVSRRRAAK
ncbi:MAG: hypothetical protein KIT69_05995 [Propionibacteriaceae bacterium]|nr:hypothetical protein [Propionibacteriaceae bacterium]